MSRTRVELARLSALAGLLVGCNHHVYSPPARTLPLESMASVGRARTGFAVEAARHTAVFGIGAGTGTAQFRHGVADDVDLSLEGNVIHVEGESAAGTSQEIYSLRIGAKYEVNPAFAVTGGQGFGFHAAGTFVSPDVGIITGFENPYVVPFHSVRVLVSVPLRSHPVDTTSAGGDLGTHVGKPELTGGFGTAFGLRIPIPPSFEPKTGVRGAALGGIGATYLNDGDDATMLLSAGGGGEIEF